MSAEQNLGNRLRRARQARGVSLRSAAHELGVSASLISQVETGKSKPSVATLYAYANLLGVSVDDVLGLGTADISRPQEALVNASSDVQRAADNPAIEMENGVRWERLAGGAGGRFESLLVTYAPGASSSVDGQLMRHPGIEYAYVLEGSITLQLEAQTHELSPGDSLQFDSTRPHMISNRGLIPARGVWFVVGRNNIDSTALPPSNSRSSSVEALQRFDSLDSEDES